MLDDANAASVDPVNSLIVYRVRPESANIPVAAHGFILHMTIDSASYAIQMYVRLGGSAGMSLYTRAKQTGTWGEWMSH